MRIDAQTALEWAIKKSEEILSERSRFRSRDDERLWMGRFNRLVTEIRRFHEALRDGKLEQVDQDLDYASAVPRIKP